MGALHGQGPEDRPHRVAHRAEVHRHALRDVRDARRAARRRGKDSRLLPLHLEGGHARRPALPVEREDALRQDLHRLSARQETRGHARARGDLQARRGGCVADRSRIPRGLRRLAIPIAQFRQRPYRDQRQEAVGLFRFLPGLAGSRRRGEYQAEEHVAPQGEVGLGRLRRIPLRCMARHSQGTV